MCKCMFRDTTAPTWVVQARPCPSCRVSSRNPPQGRARCVSRGACWVLCKNDTLRTCLLHRTCSWGICKSSDPCHCTGYLNPRALRTHREKGLVVKGIMDLGVGHAATLEPAVEDVRHAPQDALALARGDGQLVDKVTVQVIHLQERVTTARLSRMSSI